MDYQTNIPDIEDCFCGKDPCICDDIEADLLERHYDSIAHDRMEREWIEGGD